MPVVAFALDALGNHPSAALQRSARHDALYLAAQHGHGNILNLLLGSKTQNHFPRETPEMHALEDTAKFAASVVNPSKIPGQGSSSPGPPRAYCPSGSSFSEGTHELHYEQSGPSTETDDLTPTFNIGCASGHVSALLAIIENDTCKPLKPQAYSDGLEISSENGHLDVVCFLLGHPTEYCSPTSLEEAVMHASANGFVETVRLLLEIIRNRELHPNVLNHALNVASHFGHCEVAELLIREGAEVTAAVDETEYIYRKVFDHDPFFQPSFGPSGKVTQNALQTALPGFDRFDTSSQQTSFSTYNRAHQVRQVDTIQWLLEEGSNVNASASDLTYPLYPASANCSEAVVQLLVDKGANVDVTSRNGGTVSSASAGREVPAGPITRILLQGGASYPTQGTDGDTALNAALAWFGRGMGGPRFTGYAVISESIHAVLNDGPGAVLKLFLAQLPEETARDKRYGLLLQMATMAEDDEWVDLLL